MHLTDLDRRERWDSIAFDLDADAAYAEAERLAADADAEAADQRQREEMLVRQEVPVCDEGIPF
jgi:hypothetical protein